MYWDVKVVKPLPDYRLYVEVQDGRKGVFDVKPYLEKGVFRELKDDITSIAWASFWARSPGQTNKTSRPGRCWQK
jgi:Protein of unknown function (DUF2442)